MLHMEITFTDKQEIKKINQSETNKERAYLYLLNRLSLQRNQKECEFQKREIESCNQKLKHRLRKD